MVGCFSSCLSVVFTLSYLQKRGKPACWISWPTPVGRSLAWLPALWSSLLSFLSLYRSNSLVKNTSKGSQTLTRPFSRRCLNLLIMSYVRSEEVEPRLTLQMTLRITINCGDHLPNAFMTITVDPNCPAQKAAAVTSAQGMLPSWQRYPPSQLSPSSHPWTEGTSWSWNTTTRKTRQTPVTSMRSRRCPPQATGYPDMRNPSSGQYP